MAEKRLADREIGEKFVGEESRLITGTELDLFCDITGMRGDAFLNDKAAQAMGMKSRLLPGAMSFALVFSLLGRFLGPAIFTGVNNMKLLSPVFPNDKLRAETEVTGRKVTSKGDRVFVTYLWKLINQDDVLVVQGENT
ncbi:MAG TPA: MaoC family dehydratase [Dehalococcoidia bacterium]|nr:MaoC family dehydratase [Dehalococcoidia bacterium]